MTNLDWLRENVFKTNEIDCLIWPFGLCSRNEYGKVWYNDEPCAAHVVSFEIVNGFTPPVVRHKCDNPPCINPYHLLAGTQTDNVRDRVERDRGAHSEKHGRAVLTSEQVRGIYLSSEPIKIIADRFGVDPKAIRCIRDRTTWKRVTEDLV